MSEGPDFTKAGSLPGNQFLFFGVDYGWYVQGGKAHGWLQMNRQWVTPYDPYPIIEYDFNPNEPFMIDGSRKVGAAISKPHWLGSGKFDIGILWATTGILDWSEDDLNGEVSFFAPWVCLLVHFFPPEFIRVVTPIMQFTFANARVPTVYTSPPRGGTIDMWARWRKPIPFSTSGRLYGGRPAPGRP